MDWMKTKLFLPFIMAIAFYSFASGGIGSIKWNFSILVSPILFAFAVNYASDLPEIIKNALSFDLLRWFGKCSFSIYLWQGPFYAAAHSPDASKSLCLLGGITAGALSFYLIENPTRIYLNRKWDERSASRVGIVYKPAEPA